MPFRSIVQSFRFTLVLVVTLVSYLTQGAWASEPSVVLEEVTSKLLSGSFTQDGASLHWNAKVEKNAHVIKLSFGDKWIRIDKSTKGRSVRITSQDKATGAACLLTEEESTKFGALLDQLTYLDFGGGQLADAFIRAINLLDSWPTTLPVEHDSRYQEQILSTSLCGNMNGIVKATFFSYVIDETVGPYPWIGGECMGRCGKGCASLVSASRFTQDCLNHDACAAEIGQVSCAPTVFPPTIDDFFGSPNCGETLTVNITPPEAVSAHAKWQIDPDSPYQGDSGPHESGYTIDWIKAGTYTVKFEDIDIAGWKKPDDQPVSLQSGTPQSILGTYKLDFDHVEISPSADWIETRMPPDNTSQLTATTYDSKNRVVPTLITDYTWDSDNISVASVDNFGLVTGIANGKATITATHKQNTNAIGTATITVGIDHVVVTPSTAAIDVGGVPKQLAAQAYDQNNVELPGASKEDYNWKSDNTAIATVVNGLVTGVAVGTATITATHKKDANAKGTATITVNNGKTSMVLGFDSVIWGPGGVLDVYFDGALLGKIEYSDSYKKIYSPQVERNTLHRVRYTLARMPDGYGGVYAHMKSGIATVDMCDYCAKCQSTCDGCGPWTINLDYMNWYYCAEGVSMTFDKVIQ